MSKYCTNITIADVVLNVPACGIVVFFFSSRRRHTRWNCDWSSDVCSSDLEQAPATKKDDVFKALAQIASPCRTRIGKSIPRMEKAPSMLTDVTTPSLEAWRRSEERRVGRECRSRWAADEGGSRA